MVLDGGPGLRWVKPCVAYIYIASQSPASFAIIAEDLCRTATHYEIILNQGFQSDGSYYVINPLHQVCLQSMPFGLIEMYWAKYKQSLTQVSQLYVYVSYCLEVIRSWLKSVHWWWWSRDLHGCKCTLYISLYNLIILFFFFSFFPLF